MFLFFFFLFFSLAQHHSHKQTTYHTKRAASHWSDKWNVHGTQKPMHHTNYVFDNFISTTLSIEHCAAQLVQDFCHIIYVPADTVCCMMIHIPIFAWVQFIHSFSSFHLLFFLSLSNTHTHTHNNHIHPNAKCWATNFACKNLPYYIHCTIIMFDFFYRERNGFAWYDELWTISDTRLRIGYI